MTSQTGTNQTEIVSIKRLSKMAQFEPKQKGALLLRFFQNLALVRGTFWPKLVAHFEPFYPVFKTKSDNSLFHSLIPRIGLCHEKKQMNIDLQHFLEITFNHF